MKVDLGKIVKRLKERNKLARTGNIDNELCIVANWTHHVLLLRVIIW